MDFYNNIAAVAAVLMFAKFVTHRTRKGQKPGSERWLFGFHFIGVAAAAVAILVALSATADGATDSRILEWVSLGLSGLILVVDVLVDDFWYARQCRNKK